MYFKDPMTVCVFDRDAINKLSYKVEGDVGNEFFRDKEFMEFTKNVRRNTKNN